MIWKLLHISLTRSSRNRTLIKVRNQKSLVLFNYAVEEEAWWNIMDSG